VLGSKGSYACSAVNFKGPPQNIAVLKAFSNKMAPNPIIFFERDNFPPIFSKGNVVISDGTIACQDHETYLDSSDSITTVDSMIKLLVSSLCYSNIYNASSH
jgi:hypothetical protein